MGAFNTNHLGALVPMIQVMLAKLDLRLRRNDPANAFDVRMICLDDSQTQMFNVWSIYLHLGSLGGKGR